MDNSKHNNIKYAGMECGTTHTAGIAHCTCLQLSSPLLSPFGVKAVKFFLFVSFFIPVREYSSVEKCTPSNLACRRYATTLRYTSHIPDGMLDIVVSPFLPNSNPYGIAELNSPVQNLDITNN